LTGIKRHYAEKGNREQKKKEKRKRGDSDQMSRWAEKGRVRTGEETPRTKGIT
jgi:hypothetical protein